ncbi:MAG TPA: DUF805 domain-containing protein [Alphaproteobacteria bacterium]|nr:DUF805 domain-containing protein [Alphaproteobacteria bacterium]
MLTFLAILARLFGPSGRIARRWYWGGMLAVIWTAYFLMPLIQHIGGRWMTVLLFLPFYWSIFCLMSQRCHDIGRSARWLAFLAVPIVGLLWWLAVLGFRRGDPGDNQYGRDPRPPAPDYLVVDAIS